VIRLVSDPAGVEPGHCHVTAVETSTAQGPRLWGLVDFVRAARLGERFYRRDSDGVVEIEPGVCDRCPRITATVMGSAPST
jgi:hypothetical protein